MKQRFYYLPFIVVLIIVFLLGRQCSNNTPTPPKTDKDSLVKANINLQADIAILKDLTRSSDSVRIEYKYRYRTLHDTIPCEIKLVYCDSVIYHDSIAINYRDSIIYKFDTLTANYQKVAKIDSLTIAGQSKQIKKLKRKVILWKVVAASEAVLIGVGAVR